MKSAQSLLSDQNNQVRTSLLFFLFLQILYFLFCFRLFFSWKKLFPFPNNFCNIVFYVYQFFVPFSIHFLILFSIFYIFQLDGFSSAILSQAADFTDLNNQFVKQLDTDFQTGILCIFFHFIHFFTSLLFLVIELFW